MGGVFGMVVYDLGHFVQGYTSVIKFLWGIGGNVTNYSYIQMIFFSETTERGETGERYQ